MSTLLWVKFRVTKGYLFRPVRTSSSSGAFNEEEVEWEESAIHVELHVWKMKIKEIFAKSLNHIWQFHWYLFSVRKKITCTRTNACTSIMRTLSYGWCTIHADQCNPTPKPTILISFIDWRFYHMLKNILIYLQQRPALQNWGVHHRNPGSSTA